MLSSILMLDGHLRRVSVFIIFIMAVLTQRPVLAQTSLPDLSLQEAIRRTLLQNPQLHQFEFRRAGLSGRGESAANAPAMALSVELENLAGSGEMAGTDAVETTIALSSVIELGDRRQKRISLNRLQQERLGYQQKSLTLDVLGQLTLYFIRSVKTQELIRLANDALKLKQDALSTVRSRSAKGATPEIDVKRAQVALVQSELSLHELLAQHQREKVHLASFWGKNGIEFEQLLGDLTLPANALSFEQLYQQALSSPAIAEYASQIRLDKAKLQLTRSRSSLDIEWQVGMRHVQQSGDSALVLGLSVPLNQRSRNKGEVKSAIAQVEVSQLQEEQFRVELYQQLYMAYSLRQQYQNSARKIKQEIIPVLTEALYLAKAAYEKGRYPYQQWLDAQEELLDEKRRLIENKAAALTSQTVIEQLTGQAI